MSGGFGGDYFDNVGLNRGGNFITDEFNNGGGKHIAGGWVSNSGYDSQSTTNHQNQGFYNGKALFGITMKTENVLIDQYLIVF